MLDRDLSKRNDLRLLDELVAEVQDSEDRDINVRGDERLVVPAKSEYQLEKWVWGQSKTYCPLMKTAYPPVSSRTTNEHRENHAAYGWNGAFHGSEARSIPCFLQP